jgi:zinc-ribbon domain
MPYCPQCGSENEAGSAFCGDCGTRMQAEAQAAPAVEQPPGGGVRRSAIIGGAAVVAVGIAIIVLFIVLGNDGDSNDSVIGDGNGNDVATATPAAQPTEPPPTDLPPTAVPPTLTQPPPPTQAPTIPPEPVGYASPEDAMAVYFAEYALDYAGDCAFANIDVDIGSYCSQLWEDRSETLIYNAGLTFSEPDTWLLLALQGAGGGWLVADEAVFPAAPEPAVPPW